MQQMPLQAVNDRNKFPVGNRKMVYKVQDEEKKCLILLLEIRSLPGDE